LIFLAKYAPFPHIYEKTRRGVQNYYCPVYRRVQAAETLENSAFLTQYFSLKRYMAGEKKKAGTRQPEISADRAPRVFWVCFSGIFLHITATPPRQ